MKKLRLASSLMLALFLMFALTSPVYANQEDSITYTALGDSIALGIGANFDAGDPPALNGYTNMLKDHLVRIHDEVFYYNLAVSGLTSTELLGGLSDPLAQDIVAQSDIITISIGGNDLLAPFMMGLFQFLSTYYVDQTGINFVQFMSEFEAWKLDPTNTEYAHFETFFATLANEFINAIPGFYTNWTYIIEGIRYFNEDAEIYVSTVYNPFVNDPVLHDFMDVYIVTLNQVIIMNASVYDYSIVDIYTEFEDYGNPKKLAVGDLSNMAEFFTPNPPVVPVPLHPTDLGYKFIFNLHKDLME